MPRVHPVAPGPGQESVWDYPRPPALEPVAERLRVEFAGQLIADTRAGFRVLETSHPPVYYLPLEDIATQWLERAEGASYCEFKGVAEYWTLRCGERVSERAAWSYPEPSPRFAALANHLAFYAPRVDRCLVDIHNQRINDCLIDTKCLRINLMCSKTKTASIQPRNKCRYQFSISNTQRAFTAQ